MKEIVRGVNRSKSLITASQLRACRDKLQIITLQERVDWEKNLHSRCTAKQELIDKLAQEAEEQKERIRVYESKIQNLVSLSFHPCPTLTCHSISLQEEEVDKLKKRPECGHCLLALAQNFSSRLRHE